MRTDKIASATKKPLPLMIDGDLVIKRPVKEETILDLKKMLDSINALSWELDHMGSKAKKAAVPVLIEALNNKRAIVRRNAAWALGEIGPEAKEAASALGKALDSEKNITIQRNLAWALGRLGVKFKNSGDYV